MLDNKLAQKYISFELQPRHTAEYPKHPDFDNIYQPIHQWERAITAVCSHLTVTDLHQVWLLVRLLHLEDHSQSNIANQAPLFAEAPDKDCTIAEHTFQIKLRVHPSDATST